MINKAASAAAAAAAPCSLYMLKRCTG
jgi:hypothetical protein